MVEWCRPLRPTTPGAFMTIKAISLERITMLDFWKAYIIRKSTEVVKVVKAFGTVLPVQHSPPAGKSFGPKLWMTFKDLASIRKWNKLSKTSRTIMFNGSGDGPTARTFHKVQKRVWSSADTIQEGKHHQEMTVRQSLITSFFSIHVSQAALWVNTVTFNLWNNSLLLHQLLLSTSRAFRKRRSKRRRRRRSMTNSCWQHPSPTNHYHPHIDTITNHNDFNYYTPHWICHLCM